MPPLSRVVLLGCFLAIFEVASARAFVKVQFTVCPGDCDGSGSVTIDELIQGIDIALGVLPIARCTRMDHNGDGEVTVEELLIAVNAALSGCPLPEATETPLTPEAPSPTATINPSATSTAAAPTSTPTGTFAATFSPTAMATYSATATHTPTATRTESAIETSTPTATISITSAPTRTTTVAPTSTGTSLPSPTPQELSLVIGSAAGHPGARVIIAVALHTGGEEVVATENQMLFHENAPIAARGIEPACEVNQEIAKERTGFAFLPAGCIPTGNCELAKAIVISYENLAPIPNDSVLYTCAIDILPTAVPGDVFPLICSEAFASGPEGELLQPKCFNGAITVDPAP